MSKQQMPVMKCFTSFNTEGTEELCGRDPESNREQPGGEAAKVYLYVTVKNKRPAWKIQTGRRVRKEISGGRENWTLRHCVSFRLHCCRDCRRPRRYCAGFRHHLGLHRPHLRRYRSGSARSRNATGLDSCGGGGGGGRGGGGSPHSSGGGGGSHGSSGGGSSHSGGGSSSHGHR